MKGVSMILEGLNSNRVEESADKPLAGDAKTIGLMSKDGRKAWLENAPNHSTIKGLFSLRTNQEQVIEKVSAVVKGTGSMSYGMTRQESYWTLAGAKEPYISKTLKEAANGTSKYYYCK